MPRPGKQNRQPGWEGKSESRGGKRSGGRGGRPADDRETQISKKLSYVLRHGAIKEGLEMDERGFVRVDDIVSRGFTLALLLFMLCIQDTVG